MREDAKHLAMVRRETRFAFGNFGYIVRTPTAISELCASPEPPVFLRATGLRVIVLTAVVLTAVVLTAVVLTAAVLTATVLVVTTPTAKVQTVENAMPQPREALSC